MTIVTTTAEKIPPPRWFRWMVLVFISIAMFGNYYIYDCISPLADVLASQLHFTDSDIGLLQAIYSIPNVFMVLIGGFVIDRIGTRKSTFIFGVLCLIGALVTTYPSFITAQFSVEMKYYILLFLGLTAGVAYSTGIFKYVTVGNESKSNWIRICVVFIICAAIFPFTLQDHPIIGMAYGRLLFGLGAESLIVAVTTAIAKWFKGKELSFAFGINLTIARLGSFAALNSPSWAKAYYQDWQYPLIISVFFGTACVVGAILYWVMEARSEKIYELGDAGSTDKVVFSDIFHFGTSYWYIVALCITFYSAIFPFQTFAVKFFQDAHGASRELGGFLSSMLTLFAMICTPLFGLLVDRVGKRSLFMMLGSILLIPVYLIMAYSHISLYVPMAMMGIAFSLIPAIMWPSVAYVVEQSKLGTAYGLMTMIQNIGLAGFNLLIGWANDYSKASETNPDGYQLGMLIFSVLGFFGLAFAFLLRRSESGQHAHGLETITTANK